MTAEHHEDGPELRPGAEFDQRARSTGQLHVQRCVDCEAAIYPPRVLCHRCGSAALDWRPVAGEGTVYSVTELHSRSGRSHAVALIDMVEGFRMMATVPLDTPIGSAVRLAGLGEDDEVVAAFAPSEAVPA